MRSLFWFTPAVVIPLICLQLSSGQPSSTATIDIRPTPQLPLPSKALLPQVPPTLPKVKTSQVRPSTKKQAQKVIASERGLINWNYGAIDGSFSPWQRRW